MTRRRLPSGQGPALRRWRAALPPSLAPTTRPGGRGAAPAGPAVAARDVRRDVRRDGGRVDRASDRNPDRHRDRRRGRGGARRVRAPRQISGRTAAVALVLLGLLLVYAYPVRTYLDQRAQIARMQTDQVAQRERIGELSERLRRWEDPDYVITQVRTRLRLVRTGELTYLVVADPPAAAPSATDPAAPWFSQLWGNLQAADNITAEMTAGAP